MLIEIILALSIGILLGIVTGLTPGIHVNLVATTLYAFSPILLGYFQPLSLSVFIVSLAVVHSFLDTIPSVYLGAPESENALSVLPGQKMLLQGQGSKAVKITIAGTYAGMVTALFLVPLFIFIASRLYPLLKPFLPYMLIGIIIFMILREKQKYWSFLLFLLSGSLGIVVFSQNLNEPLFPLLSGLFGVSGLMISYFENTKIPPQREDSSIGISLSEIRKAVFGSTVGVFLIQFFPGLGPAQGAVIASQFVRGMKDKIYLALVGAQGTMSVIFSLVTFYTLGKAKDGSIVVISKILEIDSISLIVLLATMMLAGSISVMLVLFFSKLFSKLVVRVNYRLLVVSVIIFIFFMSFVLNGLIGCLILVAAVAIGLIAPLKGIGRNHAMGCLILPVILYLLV